MLQHRANITGRQPIIISPLYPGCGSASGDELREFQLRASKKLPPPHRLVCAHASVASSCLMPPTRRRLGAIVDFRLPHSNMTDSRPFRRGTLVEILLLVESQAGGPNLPDIGPPFVPTDKSGRRHSVCVLFRASGLHDRNGRYRCRRGRFIIPFARFSGVRTPHESRGLAACQPDPPVAASRLSHPAAPRMSRYEAGPGASPVFIRNIVLKCWTILAVGLPGPSPAPSPPSRSIRRKGLPARRTVGKSTPPLASVLPQFA